MVVIMTTYFDFMSSFISFPSQPHSPVRILVLSGSPDDRVNPRLTQFIRDSPPRIRGEWHLGQAAEPEDEGLTAEEFKKAMGKLRKQVYSPPYPPRRAWKRGLFSRRTDTGADDAEEEDGKDCTICLEAFVPNDQVLVTPCNHMFHNDCLVPWVKSQGKCPVCRFVLCQRKEGAPVRRSDGGANSNSAPHNARDLDDEELPLDLVTLIRAMEEAFGWVNYARAASSR
ncbi:hypothetical protein B296_00042997 [Ensete ventricosum]|uniref:RING-type domain-containing protein n=1 Tax=Ensete ventricosum TaxID=4639 RepID=A0A426ZGH1_ENSVE|nr:hypothetical protein B296_00042997 [Ensete ventricosum]